MILSWKEQQKFVKKKQNCDQQCGLPHSRMLLLLLSHFSRVRLCATPWTTSPPGSSVHGIFQARVLELGAIVFSNYIAVKVIQWHTYE